MTTTYVAPDDKRDVKKAKKVAASDRSKAENALGMKLVAPAIFLMLLVTAYPILQAIYDSLFDFRLTDPDNRSFTGLSNYWVILTDRIWWTSIAVTVFITVVTVADIVANPDLLLDEGVVAALDLAGYDQLACYTELTGLPALPEL